MPFASNRGVKIYYESYGDGPPMVLVHANPFDHRLFTYQIASLEGLMHGLYLLWWVQERAIPASIVAAILAAGDLAIVAFEVPTGWFADRFGHRVSLIIGLRFERTHFRASFSVG